MNDSSYIHHSIRTPIRVGELVTIHYFEYDKDYRYNGERHDFWELVYADRGRVISTCEGEEHLLSDGDLLLLPPNCFHTIRADRAKPANVFIISFTETGGALDGLGGRRLPLSATMKELIHSMVREGEGAFVLPMSRVSYQRLQPREDAPFGGEQMIKMRLEELLILLCRREASPKPWGADKARYDDDIAARVLQMLEEHIYGRLTLSDITAAMGYGKTYLSNIFKRVYGKSIMDCYTQLKINEAKYLLREGSMSVSQISDSLGFSSPQYFSKRFAAMAKMPPRQYAGSVREDWTTDNEETT